VQRQSKAKEMIDVHFKEYHNKDKDMVESPFEGIDAQVEQERDSI
jgi:hypothetical protein